MMKWDCKTQLSSHTYFPSGKKANLFCKSKTMEEKISFYFLIACPTQNKCMNQLKH